MSFFLEQAVQNQAGAPPAGALVRTEVLFRDLAGKAYFRANC